VERFPIFAEGIPGFPSNREFSKRGAKVPAGQRLFSSSLVGYGMPTKFGSRDLVAVLSGGAVDPELFARLVA
jgi:hypothetical protein